jgi:hypothetical protein
MTMGPARPSSDVLVRRLVTAIMVLSLESYAQEITAQVAGRRVGATLAHSLESRASSRPAACATACDDVLAPLTLSSLEIEASFPLRNLARGGLDYIVRAVPLVIARENPTEAAQLGPRGWGLPASTTRSTTVGLGIKPVGFRGWLRWRRWSFHADAAGGFLRFGSPVLASNAARFNFVLEFGAGVRYHRTAMSFRRHHLSNGGMGEVNPGLNSYVLALTYAFR